MSDESSENTSKQAKEKLSENTSQLNDQGSVIMSSDEEVSYASSDSDDVFEGLSEIESDEDDAETADFGSEQAEQNITSGQSVKDSLDTACLKQRVNDLRQWVEKEAKFYGRTDEDFLIMFLLGCKMDMVKAKTKMTKYYHTRKKIPQWWENRHVNDFEDLLQKRMCVLLTDTDPHLPTLLIIRYGRYGSDPKAIDRIMALHLTMLDIALRRNNCQQNGAHGIIDCLDYPLWLAKKLLNPVYLYNLAQCTLAAPVRFKNLHLINFPLIGRTVWHMCKSLWPKKLRDRFTFSGSDLTPMREKVDPRLLPIEYGGTNGSLVDHEEAFIQEMHNYSDYLIDDNKYGFDKN